MHSSTSTIRRRDKRPSSQYVKTRYRWRDDSIDIPIDNDPIKVIPVAIKDALIQTDLEPESAEEPFGCFMPPDCINVELGLLPPTGQFKPNFEVFTKPKKPEIKDWSDCSIFQNVFPKARNLLLK
jgi:hypothetical protein